MQEKLSENNKNKALALVLWPMWRASLNQIFQQKFIHLEKYYRES